jgi:predicted N-formylglutamate amidohydrolase
MAGGLPSLARGLYQRGMTAPPVHVLNPEGSSRWVLLCDHASNRVPEEVGSTLGLPPTDLARHIAWDPGTAGVVEGLSSLLDAPAVLSDFSRLVIDPNRGEDDPTLLMKLYDGTIIPGNRHADAAERERRLALFHRPYHAAVARLLDARDAPVICSIHSFTPQLRGRPPRPWQVGVLFSEDRRLSDPLIARLKADSDLCVGVNQPYSGHLPGDTMDRHAIARGRLHVLVELRNDLIFDTKGQHAWAARLAPLLQAALEDAENGRHG